MERCSKIKFDYSPVEIFESIPEWVADSRNYYAKRGAAFISIAADDPEIFADVDPAKPAALVKTMHKACKPFFDKLDINACAWNIISVPTVAWAKIVFPNCSEEEAIEKLWDAIFKAVRVDTPNPANAWQEHKKELGEKVAYLNEKQFVSFHYKNSIGTDITVGMTEKHLWAGGGELTQDGLYFFPNMPTEEVFCTPHKDKVNGIVYSALPLNYQGNIIDEFSITYKDGIAVDYSAKKGYDTLKALIETDKGSHHLGELALIPNKSPISDMNILFYNTLFDENASCHFAIGLGFPMCIENGCELTKEQLLELGVNDSVTHVDFMIGTPDMSIVATDKDGNETVIFDNGNWAI